jgi:hypothetical protein
MTSVAPAAAASCAVTVLEVCSNTTGAPHEYFDYTGTPIARM